MVFGLLIFGAVPAIPTVIGVSKAINAKDDANARGPIEEIEESEEEQKERLEKFNLTIYTESSSSKAKQVDGKYVYLKNGKVGAEVFVFCSSAIYVVDVLKRTMC